MTLTQKAEQMARKPVKNRAGITPKETWHKAKDIKWFAPNLCNGKRDENAAASWKQVNCPRCLKKRPARSAGERGNDGNK